MAPGMREKAKASLERAEPGAEPQGGRKRGAGIGAFVGTGAFLGAFVETGGLVVAVVGAFACTLVGALLGDHWPRLAILWCPNVHLFRREWLSDARVGQVLLQ
jgi:hypothetical protein